MITWKQMVRHLDSNGQCWSVEDHGFDEAGVHQFTRRTSKGRRGKVRVVTYDLNDQVVESIGMCS